MQAFERLEYTCIQLRELAGLAERLNQKLNRTEGYSKLEDEREKIEEGFEMSIVGLFNSMVDKMEVQINVIGNNTERSMNMID
jgi:DNA polymerase II large subunit